MYQAKPWVYFREINIAFAFMPKVANTSMKVAFAKMLGIPYSEDGKGIHSEPRLVGTRWEAVKDINCPKIAFTRYPIDRLISCYRDKIVDKKCKNPYYRRNFSPDVSFQEFVEFVCNTPDEESDHHFASQTYLLGGIEAIEQCQIYRYENIDVHWIAMRETNYNLWRNGLPRFLDKLNSYQRGSDCSIDDAMASSIAKRYFNDRFWWNIAF
jgi:hypothetical protein